MSDRAHGNAFDFLRVAAATAVLISHGVTLYGWDQPRLLNGQTLASIAVKVFFAVSGYLVALSWVRDPHLGRFIARRALRILPGLAMASLVTVLCIGLLATSLSVSDYFGSGHVWAHLRGTVLMTVRPFDLPGVFTSNPMPYAVNGSLWTLRYEVMMYLLLAALGLATARRGPRQFGVIVMAAATVMALGFGLASQAGVVRLSLNMPVLWRLASEHSGYSFELAMLLDLGVYFFVGAALMHGRERVPLRGWFAVLLLVVATWAPHEAIRQLAVWVGLPYASLTFAWGAPTLLKRLKGIDYSYGIYIYAFPVQQLVIQWAVPPRQPFWLTLVLSLLGTLALAAFSWHVVERPALRLKPGGASRQKASA